MVELTTCPKTLITSEVWDAILFSEQVRDHGLTPVAGGLLDQTAVFFQAYRMIESDRAEHEAVSHKKE